ncbi:MAG: 4Fe-4S binding protein [Candidatus Omnitrophica bacterium]|nr:4Fe-4S binding protein [Candidatus Omnitrophota bacterium]MBU4140878.1 4Fe-4S binding protein [Candidatus Omnitrophota bacterium]
MKQRSEQSERSPVRAKRVTGKSWKEIPIGGLIDKAGSAAEYKTGDWRTFRPVRDEKKCVHCLICWMYCPDSSILVKDKKMAGFDYEHCKGCGICASVCPVKCIKMEKE